MSKIWDQQLKTIEQIYGKWREFLESEHDRPLTFQAFYEQEVETAFEHVKLPLFDADKFPSLRDRLPLAGRIKRKNIPAHWNLETLPTSVTTDLERLLLAYIWKRGELRRVKHVLAGLDDDEGRSLPKSSEENDEDKGQDGPAVMWQFGRHLAKPDAQPIFDQHTSRHRIIFKWLEEGRNLEELPEVIRLNKLTTRDKCREYIEWWRKSVLRKVERNVARRIELRPAALLWADRIMFALGKAGAYKAKKSTEELARKPGAPVVAKTKRAVAEQIYCDHRQNTSAQVIKRMVNEAKLTKKAAQSYYYRFSKAFSVK
jgi:hypothetical protein